MRSRLDTIAKLAAGVMLAGVALLAAPSSGPRNIADEVRHKILTVPNITVFDNLAYEVDNGVVTLTGQVTQPIEKTYLENAVKQRGRRNKRERSNRSTAVVAVRRSDPVSNAANLAPLAFARQVFSRDAALDPHHR